MRRTVLVLAAPPDRTVYLCPACDGHWSFAEVRHVLCCPDCGSGLLRLDAGPEAGPDTPPPACAML